MNGPAHYAEAAALLALGNTMVAEAQAHATLALAAATIDVGLKYDGAIRHDDQWREVTKT